MCIKFDFNVSNFLKMFLFGKILRMNPEKKTIQSKIFSLDSCH